MASLSFKKETLVHRVIIKPEVEKVSKGGIVIARDDRAIVTSTDRGTIVMYGPRAWKDFGCEEPPVKEGDKVIYARYGAKVIKDPETSEFFIICNDEDVLVGYEEINSNEEKESHE